MKSDVGVYPAELLNRLFSTDQQIKRTSALSHLRRSEDLVDNTGSDICNTRYYISIYR